VCRFQCSGRSKGRTAPFLCIERSLKAIDIANALDTKRIVLWLAREGTYVRESKDSRQAVDQRVESINRMLAHDPEVVNCELSGVRIKDDEYD